MRPVDAAVDPVLERDLERLLDGHRAVGREQEVRIVDRHHGGERLGQLDHDGVAVAQHGRVGDLAGLGGEGGIELGDAVAEGVDPQGRDRIEVAAAVGVDQLAALGPLDHEGRVACVGRHLGEPVPDHGGVPLDPGRLDRGWRRARGGLRAGTVLWIGAAHRPILDQTEPAGPGDALRENGSWT